MSVRFVAFYVRNGSEERRNVLSNNVTKQARASTKNISTIKQLFIESSFWTAVFSFVTLLLLWEIVVRVLNVNPILLPAPSSVFIEFFGNISFYLPHAWVTFYEAMLGFLLGMIIAIGLGIAMSHSTTLEKLLLPIAVLSNVTPIMAIAPLFILWFGFDAFPKILIAAIITFFPMLVNSIAGFRSIDENHYEYMLSLHASKKEILLKLRLPNSLPHLFSAAKSCISLSIMGAVVGEWSGSTEGLGNVIMMASNYMQTNRMFAAIFLLAFMGVSLTQIVRLIELKVLSWHTSMQRH